MHKAIIILCTFLMGLISCSEEEVQTVDLTLDSFVDHLTPEMSYQEIVKTFGDPVRDDGSGIHIYVYELEDQTEIWIGYTDSIVYAIQMDGDRQELQVLID